MVNGKIGSFMTSRGYDYYCDFCKDEGTVKVPVLRTTLHTHKDSETRAYLEEFECGECLEHRLERRMKEDYYLNDY